MAQEQAYNSDHLISISEGYRTCQDVSDSVISLAAAAQATFESNYKGQGKEVTTDAFVKIAEHLDLIKSCFEVMEEYVDTTRTELEQMDATIIPNTITG